MSETTTPAVITAGAARAIAEGRLHPREQVLTPTLVAYAGSMTERHGLCWLVAQPAVRHFRPCQCRSCLQTGSHSILVCMDRTMIDHVRSTSYEVLDLHDERVPAILRPCQGCGAEPGQSFDLFCLSSQAQ